MTIRFQTATKTDVGLKRKINEDSLVEHPDNGIFAVADGMGGHEAGEVASAMVCAALAEIVEPGEPEKLCEHAVTSLLDVNARLIAMGKGGPERKTIGSTVAGVAIGPSRYACFWAGDSRAYRIRGREIQRLTRDHSLTQDLVDAGLLAAGDAEKHPDANVITRAVGASEDLSVDVSHGDTMAGDLFLLATDGVTRMVPDPELAVELTTKNPNQAIVSIAEKVLARGAPDNFTAIIVRVL